MLNLRLGNSAAGPRRQLQTQMMFRDLINNKQPTSDPPSSPQDDRSELIQQALLELMASILLTYSAFYIPETGTDCLELSDEIPRRC